MDGVTCVSFSRHCVASQLFKLWCSFPPCVSFLVRFQAAKMKQKIRSEEIEIEVVERRKLIDVEEQEILRKDKELIATVRRPAEAESFKVETLAQGRRYDITST